MQNMPNSQQQQMAAMAMNGGMVPVNGTPVMGNLQRPGQRPEAMPTQKDPFQQLNTYIYDYFIRNGHKGLAKAMVESELKLSLQRQGKTSPNGRNVNGVDTIDEDGLPKPELPTDQLAENSFLGDWWCQFWDIWSATRHRGATTEVKSHQYAFHTRGLATLQNQERNKIMAMQGNPAQNYQNLMRMNGATNGGNHDLKRQAMNNQGRNGQNPMANMAMNKQAMMSAQMQRDPSNMDMNGQRPQSPGQGENAPSPNKRPRVEGQIPGGMGGNGFNEFAQQGQGVPQKPLEVYTQSLTQHHGTALNNHAMAQAGVQGSPMPQQTLLGQEEIFTGNNPRPGGMPAGAPGQPQQGGNHALQDYQMQLMLLEQQNKKRLLMARQEQDNMSTSHNSQGAVGGQGFAAQAMSPQGGSRAGPSPNPADQMKRGTPKLNQVGLPGSPMPDASMQQQRNSPAPNMGFDPNQMPPGMPPQFGVGGAYPQMGQAPMMRPPSSHPGFNGQQMSPQQLEAMRQAGMPNGGVWRGPGGPGGPGPQMQPGMMPGQGQQMGGPMNPNQRNPMPPPPAPPAGEQPRAQEPSPSQSAAAPPTPNQSTKPNPKKKVTKNDKKPTKAKGANTGATPAASGEEAAPTPTPSTPITPMHPGSFNPNSKSQPGQPQAQSQPPAGPPPSLDVSGTTFGDINDEIDFGSFGMSAGEDLSNFDFDTFLHVSDDPGLQFEGNFFGDGVEAVDMN